MSSLIFNQLAAAGCDDRFVYYELDWIVDQHTVLLPDLMVVCGQPVETFLEQAPQLVVEILSPSTAEKDRSVKYEIYQQQQQVPIYLIADPDTQSLEVFQLISGKYQQLPSSDAPLLIELHERCRSTYFLPKSAGISPQLAVSHLRISVVYGFDFNQLSARRINSNKRLVCRPGFNVVRQLFFLTQPMAICESE